MFAATLPHMKRSGGDVVAAVLVAIPLVVIGCVAIAQLVSGDRFFGAIIFVAYCMAAATFFAEARGASVVAAWFLGLFLGPIGVAIVAGLPRRDTATLGAAER
jgi:hypothetical protein